MQEFFSLLHARLRAFRLPYSFACMLALYACDQDKTLAKDAQKALQEGIKRERAKHGARVCVLWSVCVGGCVGKASV